MKKLKTVLLATGLSLIIALPALAATNAVDSGVNFTPQETIPGSNFQQGVGTPISHEQGNYMVSDLAARYIAAFYNWGLSIVGVIAVLILMAGGIIWITSGGDSGRIANAKKMIAGSIGGTLLLIGAWFLLNTINPDLTNLPALEINKIEKEQLNLDNHMIDNPQDLPADANLKWECLNAESQTCSDTIPPTLDVDIEICRKKLGEHGACAYNLIHCCAASKSDQKKANSLCQDKENGTACKLTSTGFNGSGYCNNKTCQACKISGTPCTNDYECASRSQVCGYGEVVDDKSACHNGYCQGEDASKGAPCGANNSGKCYETTFFVCPAGSSWLQGGTNCKSGLKCCK